MKIKPQFLPLVVMGIFATSTVFSQPKKINQQSLPLVTYNSNVHAPLTAKELKFITEVYGDKTQEDLLNHPQRLKDIKNILRNRIRYQKVENATGFKESQSLSEVPLFDDYNSNLSRDVVFNPETFNPLKYKFNFYSRSGEHYKIDNTNYYIFIVSQHHETYRLKKNAQTHRLR